MWRKHLQSAAAAAVVASMIGCKPPTSFHGDAQFPGGALGCFNQCQKIKMEMATFVYVGAFSTACACKPKHAASASPAASSVDSEAAMAAATTGVELQRRRLDEQRQQRQPGQPPVTFVP
jgi:hypothetical protein